MRHLFVLAATSTLLIALPVRAAEPDPKGIEFFENKIRPVLVEQCYKCHSVQVGKSKGSLTLDTREAVLKGGANGPALVPGNPAKSLLLTALHQDGELKMPPKAKLPDAVVADFRRWIEIGAPTRAIAPLRSARLTGRRPARSGRSSRSASRPCPPSRTLPGRRPISTASSWPGSKRKVCIPSGRPTSAPSSVAPPST